MLLSSFNLIKQHFSPTSQIGKNIFLTKQYDYPSPLIQRLYLSYLELQEILKTRPNQQIAKRINIVSNKNDKNFEKTVLGFVYALMLHSPKCKNQKTQQREKGKLLQSTYDQQLYSEKIINQITQYFSLFRNQAWTLLNNITLQLVSNYFSEIKPLHRFGFIAIFRQLSKFSMCTDDLFIALMKTLNFYDQKTLSMKYSLQLLQELSEIIIAWRKSNIQTGMIISVIISAQQTQKNYSKAKLQQQVSLMRHYLFGKLLHWQHVAHKMATYLKGQWPYHLQKLCIDSLKILKSLYNSSSEQCLVFSSQLCRYAQFVTSDVELNDIIRRISQQSHRELNVQLIGHHYSLVPISIQFLFPLQLQQQISQMSRTLYLPQQQNQPVTRVQKQNVHYIMNWIWKQSIQNFSQQSNKSYILQNAFQDIVRWCIMSHNKNLQLRSFVIQWIFYNTMHNQILFKSVKQAYFFDWLYYLKISQKIDFNAFFGILTTSIHILNYFAFCSPNIAESLFVFILGKTLQMKTSYQSGPISQGLFRTYINQILKRASHQGILRVRQILYQSQLSHYIKSELQLRIYEGQNVGIQVYDKQIKQSSILNKNELSNDKLQIQNIKQSQLGSKYDQPSYIKQQIQYYGNKNINISFDIKDQNRQQNDEQDDLIYTSHQLIPSSPQYHQQQQPNYNYINYINNKEDKLFNLQQQQSNNNNFNNFNKIDNDKISYKRDNVIPVYQLEKQINQNKQYIQSIQSDNKFINYSSHSLQSKILQSKQQNQKLSKIQIQKSPISKQQIQKWPISKQQNQKLSNKQIQKSSQITSSIKPQQQQFYKIKLQKQFLQQMGQHIKQLLYNPTVLQFTQYIKQLIKILKQYKKSSQQQQMIQKFLQQSAKILYIAFNKQFQSFQFNNLMIQNKKQSDTKQSTYLTYFLIKSINQYWKQSLVVYNVFVYKKLVKYLCQAFSSCQFAFYYVFLQMFKKGVPHYRQMKPWLFNQQRQRMVIPVLQKILGKKFKMHVYQNAQVLKIQ